MAEVVLAVPGDPAARTGGYLYDARVVAELRKRGHSARSLALPGDFPRPTTASLDEACRLLGAVPSRAALIVDGLAYGALPAERILALGRPAIALVHHPLALETGLEPDVAARLEETERRALAVAAGVIVASDATRRLLIGRYGVPADRVEVAEPGVDPAPRARGSRGDPVILTVATVTPRKNHLALLEALARLQDLRWRWRVVGSLDRDPDCATRLREAVAAGGLETRVDLCGEVGEDALAAAYASVDLFALPSLFEGYGMAHAEALARGLPVVAGDGPASADLVPPAAGALVTPGDVGALCAALRRLIEDRWARQAAADAAWAHARTLPRWSGTAAAFERAIAAAAGAPVAA